MIGYYIHHHGLGHLTRARAIAAASRLPVVGLSSLPAPTPLAPFADWIGLERDDEAHHPIDVAAGGRLHWAPVGDLGYAARMHRLAQWIGTANPQAVVVDVSVEVTALVRLLGARVVTVAQPGVRADPAHQLAYGLSSAILAPWSDELYRPEHLAPFRATTCYVGAISRFDGRTARPVAAGGPRSVLALFGRGGSQVREADIDDARAADPTWTWQLAGGQGTWAEDLWPLLEDAGVVVAHAGLNAVAEIAAARRPAVLIAQRRPFGEQDGTAAALASAGLALSVPSWPAAEQWPELLDRASRLDGQLWSRWSSGEGAARAAAVIGAVVYA